MIRSERNLEVLPSPSDALDRQTFYMQCSFVTRSAIEADMTSHSDDLATAQADLDTLRAENPGHFTELMELRDADCQQLL